MERRKMFCAASIEGAINFLCLEPTNAFVHSAVKYCFDIDESVRSVGNKQILLSQVITEERSVKSYYNVIAPIHLSTSLLGCQNDECEFWIE